MFYIAVSKENCNRNVLLRHTVSLIVLFLKFGISLLLAMVIFSLFLSGSLLHVFGVRVSETFHLTCVHIILVRFGLLVTTFCEIAAHSVDHVFSLYFDYLYFSSFPVFCVFLFVCLFLFVFWGEGVDLSSDCFNSLSLHTFYFYILPIYVV